jgi:hypothetical protein
MRLRPPEPEVFNGLGVLQDGVSGVSSLLKPIRKTVENYAKVICRHSSSAGLPVKDERVHG